MTRTEQFFVAAFYWLAILVLAPLTVVVAVLCLPVLWLDAFLDWLDEKKKEK